MKIYYMTQADVRPPTFVAFTDKAGNLHFSAERYWPTACASASISGHADRDSDEAAVR